MPPFEYGVEYFYSDGRSVHERRTVALDEKAARFAVTNRVVAGAVLMRRPAGVGGTWEAEPDD